ncbi:hypothetical protein [Pectobacterium phage CX5]|uniref:Uncharacterized protein n=2 Tax=Kotilavirus TaxID=2732921 RepID=A0A1B1PEE0_9CAUD|nr:hypothetical protein PP16_gp38 [Pectobacterium phage PP16]ANT45337.1 hypothetical protein PP16_gp38 [Pectobacterium phage PP16]QFP93573.1 hypothetical protein [Pectobacterium phage CX5]QFP93628.1 hypothetical protein [Pectobacterium phage CX5-1]
MSKPVNKHPRFSVEQVQYLERMFPEINSSGQSYSELQYRAGQRSVLEQIRMDARVEVRYVQREILS